MANKTITTNKTTWKGTSGKDTVYISNADSVSVNTGAGNDSVMNILGYYASIDGGSGNDTLVAGFDNYSSVNGSDGKDYIENSLGIRCTLSGGADNDKIWNSGDRAKIDAGAGNDSIYNYSDYTTIKGGTGNDTVSLNSLVYYNVIEYASGDGNDVIYNLGATDTLKITGAKYTKKTSGSDVILTVGKGSVTLKGAKGKTLNIDGTLDGGAKNINNTVAKKLVNGTNYADTIKNSGNYVTINASGGNDKISNEFGNNSSIVAGAGNDSIYNRSFYTTILGDAGKDTVYNYNGAWALINTGDGDDSIHNINTYDDDGHYVTITSGAGNDKISNEYGNYLSINAGDGNDSVYNRSYCTSIDGGDGADTIRNYNGALSSINGGAGNDLISLDGNLAYAMTNVTANGGKGNDTIITFGATAKIYGGDGSDSIVSDIDGSNESGSKITIFGGAGDDTIRSDSAYSVLDGGNDNDNITNFAWNTSINGGKGNDFIENACFYNGEGSYVTIKGGAGNDSVSLHSSGHHNLIEYASGDGNDVIYNLGATDTLKITGAKYTKKTSGSDVILTVGKGSVTLKGAKGKTLNIDGTLDGKLNIPSNAYTYNGHSYYIYSGVASTWQEAKTYCEARGGHLAVINNAAENKKLFSYMKSKGYDSAYFGFSDAAKEGTWTWVNGEKISYKNWASGEPSNGNNADKPENYAMFYWKFTDGKWNDGDFTDYGTDSGGRAFICEWDTVTSSTPTVQPVQPAPTVPSGDVLKGTNGHDNLKNGNNLNTSRDAGKIIYGYDGNDTITNYADNVYISGGNGNDYITSRHGSNATVLGGAGADNITVQSNNALVYGDEGNDRIITYNEGNFVYGGNGNDYIDTENNNNGFVSGDAGNDTIVAYKGTHLTLSGGAGNDSLWGGANSDTLIGGAGNDIFVYRPGQGTDHITDFSSGDMLKILKTNGSEGGTFSSATFSSGNLTLAISGGGTVILDNVSAGDKININDTTKTISGTTLK